MFEFCHKTVKLVLCLGLLALALSSGLTHEHSCRRASSAQALVRPVLWSLNKQGRIRHSRLCARALAGEARSAPPGASLPDGSVDLELSLAASNSTEDEEDLLTKEVRAELKMGMRDEVQEDLADELVDDVWEELRVVLEEDVKNELKDEFEDEVRAQLRRELEGGASSFDESDEDSADDREEQELEPGEDEDEEVEPERAAKEKTNLPRSLEGNGEDPRREMLRQELVGSARDELRAELEEKVRNDLAFQLADDVREELRKELEGVARFELRQELEDEVQNDLKWELR